LQLTKNTPTLYRNNLVFSSEIPDMTFELLLQRERSIEMTKLEELQYNLRWYSCEVITDASSGIFNGVPAFISLLHGQVALNESPSDPVRVLRIQHPIDSSDNCDFTYGILIRTSTQMSDLSGWILFYDCCSQEGGMSNQLYQLAKKNIEKLATKITIKSMTLSHELFRQYIPHSTILPTHEFLETGSAFRDGPIILRRKLDAARGLLAELITFRIIYSQENLKNIEMSVENPEGEIDIRYTKDQEVFLVEVKLKLSLHEIDEIIGKLKEKYRALITDYSPVYIIYSWYGISNEIKTKLREEGIEYKIIKDLALKSAVGKEMIQKLHYIFRRRLIDP